MIHIIRTQATKGEIANMLKMLGSYVKVAVDIKRKILAGGGELHADCEAVLIDDGSKQEDIWGADWVPETKEVRCAALINIRPRENRSMEIQDVEIRAKIETIIREKLEI